MMDIYRYIYLDLYEIRVFKYGSHFRPKYNIFSPRVDTHDQWAPREPPTFTSGSVGPLHW